MANKINIKFKKKEFNSSYDVDAGTIVFDTLSKTIFLGGERFDSSVRTAVYDSDTKILQITDIDGGVISLNLKDDTSGNEPSSLLAKLRDDINTNTVSISTLTGTGETSISAQISKAIAALASSITTASNNNGVVTLKDSIKESDGVISNDDANSIVLAKIATTGSSSDVTVTYNSASTDVQTSISDIDSRITTLSTRQIQYIEPSSNATTPSGFNHYYASGSAYTGSLAASADTMNKIYLCRTDSYTGNYHQIMTVQSGSSYKWIDTSSTTIDLSGYVKSITINGKTYTPTASGDIAIGSVVNKISGETEVSSSNGDYISVTSTDTITDGVLTSTLESNLKVIEIDKSTESNNGIPTSLNVKNYVEDNLTTIRTWTEDDIPS